jgi:hypothetical protein
MKLGTDPFPIDMVKLMVKKVLVHTDQAKTTKGKNVIIFDELHTRMIKPHNPEIGVWKENVLRKPAKRAKPMMAVLIEKYQQQLEENWRYRVTRGIKQDRFFEARNWPDQLEPRRRFLSQLPRYSITQVLSVSSRIWFTCSIWPSVYG